MGRAFFEVFRFIIVFVVVFVNSVLSTIRESVRYIVWGHHLTPRITFFILYVLYVFAFLKYRPLFMIMTAIWLYCEIFVSIRTVVDIYREKM